MSDETRTRQGRRKQKEKVSKKSSNKQTLFKQIAIVVVITLGLLGIFGGFSVYSMIKNAPPLDPSKLTLALNPEIFDQNDEVFTRLSASQNRREVSIDEIPRLVEDAFISVEDIRFRDHFGIDIRRIGGALKANVTDGFGAEGASTITQQVVKNLFLTDEKRLTRKIQEQYLAIKLEQTYSKDQILEMYLNAIYFSEGAYGVAEAADRYFSKTLAELEVEDAALLAGIPQRPNYFNPFKNPEAAEKRRNIVIHLMERHGKITSEQANKAREVSVADQLNRSETESYPYRAFLDQVMNEVEAIDGITVNDIYTGGLKIYTTLDQEAQKFTDALLQTDDFINFPDEQFQAGITVVDTKTGEIKAIGGSREKEGIQRGFNYATDAERSPGSTIKPILDYGPAIEHFKWSTFHQIVDEPYTYSDGTPVKNFNDRYENGLISMRRALLLSRNVPALKAFQEVGIEQAAQFGKGLGIPLDTIEEPYSLGGFTTGISSLQLAGAYAAFGNEGIYHRPYAVRKVVFPDGRTIDLTPDSHVAMNDYTAFMITDMLKSAVAPGGTGASAKVDNLPMAGKTGTSNNYTNIWFAGYTTNYSIAVWTGYNDQNISIDSAYRGLAREMFKHLMTEISKGKETLDFKQPNSVVRVGVEKSTGLLPSEYTPQDEIIYEYFVRGTEPTEVSELYMKPDIPTDLIGSYNEVTDQIILSWSYPEEEREKFSFELELSINEQDFEVISLSEEMQHIIFNPESNSIYHFRLRAVSWENQDVRSDPIELKVEIPDKWLVDDDDDPSDESEIPNLLDELDNIIGDEDDSNDDEDNSGNSDEDTETNDD